VSWVRIDSMSMLTTPRIEGTITVRGGRKLSFAEFGPPRGRAVVWLHGTPGARRQIPEAARLAAVELDVRIIGIDRPGVGLSTPHLYDSILDFTPDLEIVLDRLGIGRVAVIGLSGGAPYALAASCALGERVAAVGVLGGVVPTRGADAVGGGLVGFLAHLAPVLPALRVPLAAAVSSFVRLVRPVASPAFDLYALLSPEGDRRVFARPEVKAMFLDDLVGNSRRGLRAPVFDLELFTRPWGFSLGEVRAPVHWWHGDADHIVPLEHARRVVPRLPRAALTVRCGESHLGGFALAEEVLGTLLSLWDETSDGPVPPAPVADGGPR
jgi:pimeloyl-ACP methyl ester carboxylesterase